MPCDGGGPAHCCSLAGFDCVFLDDYGEDIAGWYVDDEGMARRFSCSLRADLGDWAEVHQDPGYVAYVRPTLDALRGPGEERYPDCGDFEEACSQCRPDGVEVMIDG